MSVKLNKVRAKVLERLNAGETQFKGSAKSLEYLHESGLVNFSFILGKRYSTGTWHITELGKFALAEYQKAQVSA